MGFTVIRAYGKSAVKPASVKDFIPWGADNLYPQRLISIVAGTARMCIDRRAQFIEGNGFINEQFYKAVCHPSGLTIDQLLKKCASDLSFFGAYALHVQYNAMGKVVSVCHIPFEKVRFGLPDDLDVISKIYIVSRLDITGGRRSAMKSKIEPYDTFNPDKDIIQFQMAEAFNKYQSIAAYRGQVLTYVKETQGHRFYPLSLDEAAWVDIEAELSLKKSRRGDIKNGFRARTLITKLGTSEPSDEQREKDANELKEFVGDDAAAVLVEYADTELTKTIIQPFEAPDASKRYEVEGRNLKEDIMDSFGIPKILYGREVAGKLGTSQEFQQAVNYVQRIIVDSDQRQLENDFKRIFENFHTPINSSGDYTIGNLSIEQAMALAGVMPNEQEQTDPNKVTDEKEKQPEQSRSINPAKNVPSDNAA